MIPAPIYAFVPFFPGDRVNKGLGGEFLSEAGTGLSWTPSWYGVGATVDAANEGMLRNTSIKDSRLQGMSSCSGLWVFKWTDPVGSDNFGALQEWNGADKINVFRFGTSSNLSVEVNSSTEIVALRNDSAAVDDGEIYCVIQRWVSDVEQEQSTYRLPGFEVMQERVDTGAANVAGGTVTIAPTDGVFIGGNASSAVGLSGLHVYAFMMWNRALTRRQLKTVAANPHAFIRPSVIPVVFAPAVGATPHGVFGLPLQGPFAGPFG